MPARARVSVEGRRKQRRRGKDRVGRGGALKKGRTRNTQTPWKTWKVWKTVEGNVRQLKTVEVLSSRGRCRRRRRWGRPEMAWEGRGGLALKGPQIQAPDILNPIWSRPLFRVQNPVRHSGFRISNVTVPVV
eukprot:gene16024-biopygen13116